MNVCFFEINKKCVFLKKSSAFLSFAEGYFLISLELIKKFLEICLYIFGIKFLK